MTGMNAALTILGLGVAVVAAPTDVNLNGKVRRTAGGPISGVSLSLQSTPSITATSATDGSFRLLSGTTGLQPAAQVIPLSFTIEGSALVISTQLGVLDHGFSGSIQIQSASGRQTHKAALTRSLDMQAFTPGLNIVRVDFGPNSYSCTVLRVGGMLHLGRAGAVLPYAPALRAVGDQVVDTLVAQKTGYATRKYAITSYIDSNITITMDSAALGVCMPPWPGSSKSNPIFTDVYTADPAVMVDNCTFYIACGHDQGVGGFDLREWYLLKSTDMVNWTRTTPMKLNAFSWTNANAWAGQMIKARNGKYYWYVPINDIVFSQDRMAIGVAVSDSPEGPWKDALGKPLINDALEMSTWNITNIDQTPHTIDPTVFIDDDGQAYLQYGGFWKMVTVKLNPDMISISGSLVQTTPNNYFESPYLIKRNNVYYEIYARGGANPTTIDYATSNSPMGPWTHKGTILDTLPRVPGQDASTNHAGVGEMAGQWYIVYHVSNGPNNGGAYRREVAIDKMTFNANGTIQKVTPSSALRF